jgi:hypothetical protein
MKNVLIILFVFILNFSFAQKPDSVYYKGIFMNAQDYKNEKLVFKSNCDSSLGKIRLNHFFSRDYIDVMHGANKIRLIKDSIFGYRDCKKTDYRFFREYDHEYEIVENKSVVVYIADLPVTSSSGKTAKLVPNYFFSMTLSSGVLPLTLTNLKISFAENDKFQDLLDQELKAGNDLSSYDDVHKMYKINYLLSQTKTNKNQ